jgi:CubicO group peptidase (beta-lactamase class C family)
MKRAASVLFAMLMACASTSEAPSAPPTAAPATTAASAAVATPMPATSEATTTAASDTTVELRPGTTVTQPAGFSLTTHNDMLAFVDPDREMATWYVVVDNGTIDQAIAAAWQRAQPGFAVPLKETTKPPTRDGWDEMAQADYSTPPTSSRAVFAFARRKGTTTYVVCVDALLASLGKRGAQLGTLVMSLKAPGVSEERFAADALQPLTNERIERIMGFVDDARRAYRIPGVSLAIVGSGQLQASRVFGVVEAGKATPVTRNTLFMIGSTTKPLTTLLEASLVNEGKLTWDTPLKDALPGFSLADAALTKKVLLRHTACACTGMPRRDFDFLFEFASATPAQRVAQMSTMTPTTGFGEVFQYSNWMVGMGGYAAAHAAYPKLELGAAYDTAMRERVFKPLGMTSTTLDFAEVARRDHALPHDDDASGTIRTMRLYDEQGVMAIRPAGGVWSTAEDMAKYVLAELNKGRLPDGKQLVSEASLLERRVPRTKSRTNRTTALACSSSSTAASRWFTTLATTWASPLTCGLCLSSASAFQSCPTRAARTASTVL